MREPVKCDPHESLCVRHGMRQTCGTSSPAARQMDHRTHLASDRPDGSMEGATDEQTYDNRVRALEDELGMSTGDAQAMVYAEDLVTTSAPRHSAQHHGPNAQSETIHAHRLLEVTSQAD